MPRCPPVAVVPPICACPANADLSSHGRLTAVGTPAGQDCTTACVATTRGHSTRRSRRAAIAVATSLTRSTMVDTSTHGQACADRGACTAHCGAASAVAARCARATQPDIAAVTFVPADYAALARGLGSIAHTTRRFCAAYALSRRAGRRTLADDLWDVIAGGWQ